MYRALPDDRHTLGPEENAAKRTFVRTPMPDPMLFTPLKASHPQAQFSTRGASGDPLLRGVELGH